MSNTILVVDDSKAMRMIVRRTLRQAGFSTFDIDEAANGLEALERIQLAQPKLIVCDWNMPVMSGIELLRELNVRKLPIPFGFVTTEGTAEMRAIAHEAGARFLIAKPFTPEQFDAALRPLLS